MIVDELVKADTRTTINISNVESRVIKSFLYFLNGVCETELKRSDKELSEFMQVYLLGREIKSIDEFIENPSKLYTHRFKDEELENKIGVYPGSQCNASLYNLIGILIDFDKFDKGLNDLMDYVEIGEYDDATAPFWIKKYKRFDCMCWT